MSESITLQVDGIPVTVPAGSPVSTAIILAGIEVYRRSVTQEPRAPLCGMGICYECRVTIDGRPHSRSCQVLCRDGMEVRTEEVERSLEKSGEVWKGLCSSDFPRLS